ncbi:hypothetical protein A3709_12015 [Halioglobus sp. HI00S01]|uniref:HesA/MoeB/ThiF family protein n=1 Tax=Halioglobus sp. HI00S01 TaxID=1822214 RepID=UPI0007C29A0E|nr:HesA/MoeB/ThiF family protein [Halioglobus sp. HI00S01]KZX60310.1 hypothetical protein A3709_12015 [Halioglobus sp. HI00S01]
MKQNKEAYDLFFQRQTILEEVGRSGQSYLRNAKVLVIGAGGLGCPVLHYITAAGVGQITICDHDRVEYTNLHRQVIYSPDDVGQHKAKIAASRLRAQNPHTKITSSTLKFDLDSDITCYDLVIDCSDNFRTKFIAHDLCFIHSKPLIQASIHKFEGQVQVYRFDRKREEAPCLRCLWPDMPDPSSVQNCNEAGVLGFVPGVVGSIQASEAIKLLLGLPTLDTGETLMILLKNFTTEKIAWNKSADCALCNYDNVSFDSSAYGDTSAEVRYSEVNQSNWSIISLVGPDARLPTAHMCSLDNINELASQFGKDSKILVVCRRGITSLNGVKILREAGYQECFSLAGGLENLSED